MAALTQAFWHLVLLLAIASGFVMMFQPKTGREMLKNAAIGLALFVLGMMLLQAVCGPHWRRVP